MLMHWQKTQNLSLVNMVALLKAASAIPKLPMTFLTELEKKQGLSEWLKCKW
jgi:hypothetical protein